MSKNALLLLCKSFCSSLELVLSFFYQDNSTVVGYPLFLYNHLIDDALFLLGNNGKQDVSQLSKNGGNYYGTCNHKKSGQ